MSYDELPLQTQTTQKEAKKWEVEIYVGSGKIGSLIVEAADHKQASQKAFDSVNVKIKRSY